MTIDLSTQEDKRVGGFGHGVWLQRKKLLLKWRKPVVISAADVPNIGCNAKCPFVHPSQLRHCCRCSLDSVIPFLYWKLVFNPPVCAKESFYTTESAWWMCSTETPPYFFSAAPRCCQMQRALMSYYAVELIVQCITLIYNCLWLMCQPCCQVDVDTKM